MMNLSMKKVFSKASVLAILGTALVGGTALAADTAITGGNLSMTSPTISDFDAITLNGQIQHTNADIGNFTVIDPSGTGDGWNVNVKASQFTDEANSLTLPFNSVSIGVPSVTAQAGASAISTITKTGGIIDNAIGVKILSASQEGGMGSYDVSFADNALTLDLLPKDVKAGTYTSTVNVTVVTGP